MTTTPKTTTRSSRRPGDPAKRSPAAKPRTRNTGPLSAAELRRLKLSPEVAWYLQSRGIPLPDCPPHTKTPEPRQVRGAVFDPDRVDKVLLSFRRLRHTQGRWAGQPLNPDPWQVAYILAPVFGWVRWSDEAGGYVRIIRDLFVDVPRKAGKSSLAAGIAIYMACADGENGAQVVTAATTKKQAGFVFSPIKTIAEQAPALKGRVIPFAEKVLHPRSGSYIEVISSIADAQHGANIHCSICDELHVHKSPDLLKALETGRGSRTQPLSVIITTADSGKPDTPYDHRRRRIDQLAKRVIKDESTYGVVWCAEPGDDPFAEETQRKANPGFGISPSRMYLAAEARKAQNSPTELAEYLRLHLGIRTKQNSRYVTLEVWDANASMVDPDGLADRVCFGGLDLASTSDLTALCWLFADDAGGYDALWRFWVPEGALVDLNKRTAGSAAVWVREGWLTVTPGNVTDYDFILEQVNRDRETFAVQTIAFDPWNSSQLVTDLQNDGVTMVKLRQGFASLSAPLKACQRLLLKGIDEPMLRHGGNPVMRWMTDNLAVATDPAGNVKPDKATAAEKIDGWSALVAAMSEAIVAEPPATSAYEDHDLIVIPS